jgi:transcriptional regulator NrdR family protein
VSTTSQFACVHCGYAYTKATNTNKAKIAPDIRRQRSCLQCHRGFVTYEVTAAEYAQLQAVRKLLKQLHPPKDTTHHEDGPD